MTDQTGAVITGASVVAETSGSTLTIRSDRQGRYAFDQLLPGPLRLTVDASGFLPVVHTIDVGTGATTHDVTLRAGIFVSLEVNERAGGSASNRSALVLSDKAIQALPDDPRLFLARLLAMAGSTGRPGSVAIYVDGFREYRRLPPKDAIDMIRINSNPFSAEFSQPSARRIEIVTRPGSDGVHGEVKVQARASALDARHPLAEQKPQGRYRDVNGYIQGPLRKERVGVLAYLGQWHQDDNAFVHATVLDGARQAPVPFTSIVSTPSTVTSAMVKTDVKLLDQLVNVSYSRTRERQRNQGLEGGFDLPEHAFNRTLGDDAGRLWWTSLGRGSVNDARLEITRNAADASAATSGPAVLVLDAFNGGGNQANVSRATTIQVQAGDTYTTVRGAHTFKAGAQLLTTRLTSVDRGGFGGTFTFGADVERDASGRPVVGVAGGPIPISPVETYRRAVVGVPGYAPSQFAIVSGEPEVAVSQWNLGWFLLDDWTVSKRWSLSYGVREELQSNLARHLDLAPRASLTWSIDERGQNVLKLGSGVFHTPVDAAITLDTRRLDGVGRRQIVVTRPDFFPVVPASWGAVPIEQSTVYTKAAGLRTPYALITTVGYERQLPHGLFAMAQYGFDRGFRRLRLRDLGIVAGGTPDGMPPARVVQFESTGRSTEHELMLGLRADIRESLIIEGNYRLGRRMSDTDGPYTVPSDSTDLSNEYGAAGDDRRHDLTAGATIGVLGVLLQPSVTLLSGLPFNITTGQDLNGDTFFTDRPAFARPGDAAAVGTSYGVLTPTPRPGDTILPRNAGREPWEVDVQLAVTRELPQGLHLTAFAENLLNNTRHAGLNGVLVSPVFGLPNRALNARRLALTVGWGF